MTKAIRSRLLSGSTLACIAVLIAGPGYAQSAAGPQGPANSLATDASQRPDDSAVVNEIIVTANKRQESLLSVPASVTAMTGEQLVSKGINSVQDLVKVTPGLSYVESGRSVPVFSLRGVGYFDQSIGARPTVSVYVDEAPIPFSIEAKGAAFDLQRVEVLKGPQGTLFGQNATGGAINYIAAKPTEVAAAGLTASYARFDTADVQAYVSGPLTSTLNARLALRGVRSGDWQESYTRQDTIGAQRFVQGRLLFDWSPSDKLDVALNLNGFYDGSDTQAPQYRGYVPGTPSRTPFVPLLVNYPVAPENARAADWNPNTDYRSHNHFGQINLRADYRARDDVTITSITSYSRFAVDQLVDADGTALTNVDSRQTGGIRSFSQELRAAGDVGKISYIAGLNYATDDTDSVQGLDLSYSTAAYSAGAPPLRPLDLFSSGINQNFDTRAAFLTLDYHATDDLTLHGGVRYTQADLAYDACSIALSANAADAFTRVVNRTRANLNMAPIAPLAVGQCASINPSGGTERYFSDLNENNVSWRLGADFKPATGVLIYASASRGFKAGSGSTPAASNDLQFSPVTQESVTAYEVGMKASLFDRKADVTAAVFYYDYRDKQVLGRAVFEPNIFGAIAALTNVPKSVIKGAEAQISLYPLQGLRFTVAGTYLDTRVSGDFLNTDILGASVNYRDDAFPYTPKWQVVLDGDYRFPLGAATMGTVGANASYRSRTTSGFGGNSLLDIDAYWLVDLRAGLEFKDGRYRVQVFGRNVTDAYYWTNVARSVDNIRRYAGPPATYGVQFSVKY